MENFSTQKSIKSYAFYIFYVEKAMLKRLLG